MYVIKENNKISSAAKYVENVALDAKNIKDVGKI